MIKKEGFRHLLPHEVIALQSNGCVAENWEHVWVADAFKCDSIHHVRFSGTVCLGLYEKEFILPGGLRKKSGIRNVTLHNCTVGNHTLIEDIHNYIANYVIGDECLIQNVDVMYIEGKATFGCNVSVSVLNETGGREVPIYNGLSASLAYLIALYRHRPLLIERLQALITDYTEQHASEYGVIGDHVRIVNTGTIRNVQIGEYAVVENATRLTVSSLVSDEEVDAELLTYDASADIAVIYAPGLGISPVPLGDSDKLQVGEWALCIGNPLSEELRGTVTAGIVSALDRQIDSTTTTDKYGLKRTVTNSMIQIDAAINSGNSGGGMFNVLGQLMGVPSMKYSGSYYSGSTIEGIGLCIPVNTAKPLIEEAIIKLYKGETKKNTETAPETLVSSEKPMLGVTVAYVMTANNNYLVYSGALPGGIMVSEVTENSPAAKAGIQANDIIVEIDGDIVTSTEVVSKALERHTFGETVNVKVYRVEGAGSANSASELGEGEYIDFSIELFKFNIAA